MSRNPYSSLEWGGGGRGAAQGYYRALFIKYRFFLHNEFTYSKGLAERLRIYEGEVGV